VKKTTRSILVNLALLGLAIGGQASAAQEGPAGTEPLNPAASPFEAEIPAQATTPGGAEGPHGQPGLEFADEGSAEVPPDSTFRGAESTLPQESIALDGGSWGESALGPCCAVCGRGEYCPPTWYTLQEVRILTRSRERGLPLAFEDEFLGFDASDNPVYAPKEVLATRSADFDVAAGYAVTLGRYLGRDVQNRDRFLEFSYWGLNDWRESRAVTANQRLTDTVTFAPNTVTFGSLNSAFTQVSGTPVTSFNSREQHSASLLVGGFNRVDQQQISYESDIHNFELNLRFSPRGRPDRLVLHPSGRWRRECQPGRHYSYLFGVRVMSIDEGFTWESQGAFEVNGFPYSTVGAAYLVSSYNDLVGLQFGAELMERNCRYSWGLRAKAGPYINFGSQISQVLTDAAGDPYATTFLNYRRSASKDDAAFIGEVGLVGTYQFSPNMALRASYDFMWVVGLALAPEQLSFQTDPPKKVNMDGMGYYHGLSLGFEWSW
jgi:hypothetical protein